MGGGVVVEVVSERDKGDVSSRSRGSRRRCSDRSSYRRGRVVGGGVVLEVVSERDKGTLSSRGTGSRRWCSCRSSQRER